MDSDISSDKNQNVKNEKKQSKKQKKSNNPWIWVIAIFLPSILVSASLSFLSNMILESVATYIALIVLFVIVLIGIIADTIGVAVTASDEKSIHGMASRRIYGAKEAYSLVKNAERVSSICNDIIGDICSVVAGSASAVIAVNILASGNMGEKGETFVPLILSAVVAGFTVSGKGVGKILAMKKPTQIVFTVGKISAFFKKPFGKK